MGELEFNIKTVDMRRAGKYFYKELTKTVLHVLSCSLTDLEEVQNWTMARRLFAFLNLSMKVSVWTLSIALLISVKVEVGEKWKLKSCLGWYDIKWKWNAEISFPKGRKYLKVRPFIVEKGTYVIIWSTKKKSELQS